jgi:hypothetical protein
MTEEALKDFDKEVKKLKRIASAWASQLHDLVKDKLPAGYEEIPGTAQSTYEACQNWAEANARLGTRQRHQGRGPPAGHGMSTLPVDLRLILAHKQKTSARVGFLRFGHGVCAFDPLPALSVVEEAGEGDPAVAYHPNAWLRQAERQLGLDAGALKAEPEFHATVQTPAGPLSIQLASFETVDPPFAEAESAGGRFAAITELRDCPPAEIELLQRAYTALMG